MPDLSFSKTREYLARREAKKREAAAKSGAVRKPKPKKKPAPPAGIPSSSRGMPPKPSTTRRNPVEETSTTRPAAAGPRSKYPAQLYRPAQAPGPAAAKPRPKRPPPHHPAQRPPRFLRVRGFGSALDGYYQKTPPKSQTVQHYNFDQIYRRRWDTPKKDRLYQFSLYLLRYAPEVGGRAGRGGGGGANSRLWGWYFATSDDWPSANFHGYTRDQRPRGDGESARPSKGAPWYLATGEREIRKFSGQVTVRRCKAPRWKKMHF